MIIGMVGKARSGKNTVADMIQERIGNDHIKQYAFANPIKDAVNQLFEWGDAHSDGDLKEVVDPDWGFSPRHAYQTFGTEWGRTHLSDNIWLKIAEKQCSYNENTIITDVRFLNEAKWVSEQGGILIKVSRDGEYNVKPHASEKEIDLISVDYEIKNNAGLKELEYSVDRVVTYIKDRHIGN